MAWSHYKPITVASGVVGSDLTNCLMRMRIIDDLDIGTRAQRTGADIALFANDGTTQLDHELIDYFAGVDADAAWVWFCNPRAIRHVGTHDKTYISFNNRAGDVHVCEYNHTTNDWSAHTTVKAALDPNDDHAPAALLVRLSDSKLMCWYCAHNDSDYYQWISTSAEDASAGSETNIGSGWGLTEISYAQAWQLGGVTDDPIFLCFRAKDGSVRSWYYTISTDSGATWAAPTIFWTGATVAPYILSARLGSQSAATRIDFAATPSHPELTSTNSIYHFYYDGSAGTFHKTDGTALTLPISSSTATLVYNGSGADGRAWIWDIAHDGSNNPIVLQQRSSATTSHKLFVSRLSAGVWTGAQVVDMGGHIGSSGLTEDDPYYAGGAYFDHDDVNTVYVAREISGVHEIEKYTYSGSWSLATSITSGSTRRNFRPVCPLNHSSELEVLWITGVYSSYQTYYTGITSYPLAVDEVRIDLMVELPSVLSASDNTYRIYYGDSGASAQQDRDGTYADNSIQLVWHGREPYNCDIDGALNSKGGGTGTREANNAPYEIKTTNGFAHRFDGTDDEINFGTGLNFASQAEFTLLSVVEGYDGTGTDEHAIISNFETATDAHVLLRIDPSTTPAHKIEAFAIVGTNTQIGGTTALEVSTGTGQTVVGACYSSAGGLTVYKNTNSETLASTTGNGSLDAGASAALRIGYHQNVAADAFDGDIGSVLIAFSRWSDARIKAWANTMTKPKPGDGFYALGSETPIVGHPAMRRWGMSRGGIFRPVEIGRQGAQVI